jgi:DNA-binding response OmpR family regulator
MIMSSPDCVDLNGLRVLVVEDTLLVADVIADGLEANGCNVIGPVPRVDQALILAEREPLNGALLDVNLAGEYSFPVAEFLAAKGVPFAFMTGYGDVGLPPAFRKAPRLTKPFELKDLIALVEAQFARPRQLVPAGSPGVSPAG